MIELPLREARRYVQPLREGGSLPAVVDTDGGLQVVKFRGAGQGARALIAELVVGLLARALGFPVPELAAVMVDPAFGVGEPDPEIQDLLRASHGVNVGMRYLDGSFNFDVHAAGHLVGEELAADLVWLDAFVTNPDRTARNPNLLIHERQPWLIDHGASLYAHHDWSRVDEERTRRPFPLIRDHVLLTRSGALEQADERLAGRVDHDLVSAVLAAVPDALLMDPTARGDFGSPEESRARYRGYLLERVRAPRAFLAEAERAKRERRSEPPRPLSARR
jgi:hypothetical protein